MAIKSQRRDCKDNNNDSDVETEPEINVKMTMIITFAMVI